MQLKVALHAPRKKGLVEFSTKLSLDQWRQTNANQPWLVTNQGNSTLGAQHQ
jgi:hypothetical protein